MPILIRDQHLEEQVDTERQRRGDATLSRTLSNLARERLMELERDRITGTGEAASRSIDTSTSQTR
jgi:hypothetical protein